MIEEQIIKCKNCKTELNGCYCHNCGEKTVDEKDFSIKSILNQSLEAITSLDSKIFKTFVALLIKPGKLTVEFVSGRRKSYMQPFQVFVIANLFFFFFLTSSDIFRNPSKWFFQDAEIAERVNEISAEKNITPKELAKIYDYESGSLAKSAILIMIPFLGLVMWLVNFSKKYLYGKHLIAAVHLFSFLLFFMVLLSFVLKFFPNPNKLHVQIPVFSAIFVYLIIVQKRFYLDRIFVSIIKSTIETISILIILFAYRDFISKVSFLLIQ